MRTFDKLFARPAVSKSADTTNREGLPAWRRPLAEQFLQAVTTNTLGGTFYADRTALLAESLELHDRMLAADPALFADILVYARNQGFLRAQPVMGLAKLAGVDRAAFARVFDEVIRTPNDLADFASALRGLRGNLGGRAVKRAASRWLTGHLDEYQAIKYGADRRGSFSLRDLVRLFHPDFGGQRSAVVEWLLGPSAREPARGGDLSHLPQVAAFEALKRATSPADKASLVRAGRLPVEVASSFAGSSAAVWEAIVPQMPLFALTRHLATIERHGVMEAVRDVVVARLTSRQAVARSKMFPYRFLEASRHVRDARVRDALRDAVDLSFASVPDLRGRTAVLLDTSGSMGAYVQQAALFAICAIRKAHGDGRLLCFDTVVREVAVSLRDSVLTQAEGITANGGTDTARPLQQLYAERFRADNVLLITDEQQNTGTPFVDAFVRYRERVAPTCKLFVLDVAPYREALVPTLPDTWFMYGWSDAALRFLAMASRGFGDLLDYIRRGGTAEPPTEELN